MEKILYRAFFSDRIISGTMEARRKICEEEGYATQHKAFRAIGNRRKRHYSISGRITGV
jgi:hypothetical protein